MQITTPNGKRMMKKNVHSFDLQKQDFYCFARRHQPGLAIWFRAFEQTLRLVGQGVKGELVTGRALAVENADGVGLSRLMESASAYFCVQLQLVDSWEQDNHFCQNPASSIPKLVLFRDTNWLSSEKTDASIKALKSGLSSSLKDIPDQRSFILPVEEYPEIDIGFRCSGLIDHYIYWEKCTPDSLVEVFFQSVADVAFDCHVTNQKNRLGRLLCIYIENERKLGLLVSALLRHFRQYRKPIGWREIIDYAVNGLGRGGARRSARSEEKVAVHECGHAIAYMAGCNWKAIPDFLSTVPSSDSLGVMAEDIDRTHDLQVQLSSEEALIRLRTCLGGRLAEEMIFGSSNSSIWGSKSDLVEATKLATAMISIGGLSFSESCTLEFEPYSVLSDAPHSEKARCHQQARELLNYVTKLVKADLHANCSLLADMARYLKLKRVLLRDDIRWIIDNRAAESNSHAVFAESIESELAYA